MKAFTAETVERAVVIAVVIKDKAKSARPARRIQRPVTMESNTRRFSKIKRRWSQNNLSSARAVEAPRVKRSEKNRIAKWFLLRKVKNESSLLRVMALA
jgi:hypothetical protein